MPLGILIAKDEKSLNRGLDDCERSGMADTLPNFVVEHVFPNTMFQSSMPGGSTYKSSIVTTVVFQAISYCEFLSDMIWHEIWCDVMWCDVTWCDMMWCAVMWSDVMWCDVMWCNVIIMMWCDVMWRDVMWCDVMWWGVLWAGLMWCCVRRSDVRWCVVITLHYVISPHKTCVGSCMDRWFRLQFLGSKTIVPIKDTNAPVFFI